MVEPIYGKTYMPRKFKVVVAVPPSNDVDVYAHDLGFIAILDDTGRHRRLERHRRRRHGHDARRAGHLSAHRRRARLLRNHRRRRHRRGRRHRAARLGRPRQPQARAAEIHHRGSRPRRLPRRGRDAAPASSSARRGLSSSPRPATATAGARATTAAAISTLFVQNGRLQRRRAPAQLSALREIAHIA